MIPDQPVTGRESGPTVLAQLRRKLMQRTGRQLWDESHVVIMQREIDRRLNFIRG